MTTRAAVAPLVPSRALLNVVVFAVIGGVIVALALVRTHAAWSYYTAPLAERALLAEHRFLRPSGTGGHLLGLAGTFFLLSTLAYVARRRIRRLSGLGRMPRWLEVHIFCGVFGPILITLHTSFKFNGLVSVAYWSMVLVVLSGFVGRYLYVRIPKTIRGEELSRAELEQRAAALTGQLAEEGNVAELRTLERERATLLRRIDRLERTRQLFQLWHVFHRPLVWVMFAIAVFHVGVAVYFGYLPFRE